MYCGVSLGTHVLAYRAEVEFNDHVAHTSSGVHVGAGAAAVAMAVAIFHQQDFFFL